MKLYQENGYVNPEILFHPLYPFVLGWGARGIGKTVTINGACIERRQNDVNEDFLYLRRKKEHADICMKPELTPFKKVNKTFSYILTTAKIDKNIGGVYEGVESDGKITPQGAPLGFISSLAGIGNVRGMDFDEVRTVFYDEYTGEKTDRAIKDEDELILNTYETINRNREIDPENPLPPLRLIAMSNSNEFVNPLFKAFDIIDIAEKMVKEKKTLVTLPQRGIMIINFLNSPISLLKQKTALYRATNNQKFKNMALENDFNLDKNVIIKPRNIAHAAPIATFSNGFTIYDVKNGVLYIDSRPSGSPPLFSGDRQGVVQFMRNFPRLYQRILKGACEFQNYTVYDYVKKTLL